MNPLQLEDILSSPNLALVDDVRNLSGDFLILGLGGKMGPSLASLLMRTLRENHINKKVFGVSRFSNEKVRTELEANGVYTLAGDLLDDHFLRSLPLVKNIIYMVGQKFGTQSDQSFTWAMNAYLPGQVAKHFAKSNIVVFSTGNVYPLVPVENGGATEETPPAPIGEYAQSCLGRERIFEYFCRRDHTPTLIYRLNYALDLRYGVLNDIAQMVKNEEIIDLRMGYVNVIWQGDANQYAIRSLRQCSVPAKILNVTGPETLAVEDLANRFAALMGKKPRFKNRPAENALLNNARKAHQLFGLPGVTTDKMIEWTVEWLESGGASIDKPTHFQERKGQF